MPLNSEATSFSAGISRLKAEKSEHQRVQKYLDVAGVIILVLDTKGCIEVINRRGCQLIGMDEKQAVGKNWFECFVPASQKEEVYSFYLDVIAGKQPAKGTYENRVISGAGCERNMLWNYEMVDDGGKPAAVVASGEDITKRKTAEKALEESEHRYRLLADNAGDVIWTVDFDNNLKYISPSIERLCGYTPQEAMQLKVQDVFTAESVEIIQKELEHEIGLEHQNRTFPGKIRVLELEMIHRNGKIIPVEGCFSFIRDENGEAKEILAITRDITERRFMQEQIIMAERLATIGEMASGLAHEINNPLTGIIGLCELLLDKKLSADVSEDLAIIHHEASRAVAIVRNMLDFAGMQKTEKQTLYINAVVAGVLNLRSYIHKRHSITVKTKLGNDLPPVMADNLGIQQVLVNIIANAEYFMIERKQKAELSISTYHKPGYVCIEIADNGPGIDRASMGHLFEPFYTTKPRGKGTGLGLSVCHNIVKDHGGCISVDSCVGEGTTFTVELPACS